MKYIINERQYRLLTGQEEEILRIPFAAFGNDWDDLQKFLKRRGNPPYEITGNLRLFGKPIENLGNITSVNGYLQLYQSKLTSLGNLTSVGGWTDLRYTHITTLGNLTSVGEGLFLDHCNQLESFGDLKYVGGNLDLTETPLSKKYNEEEIRSMVEVGGKIYL
jgi:hypothetical protein